MTTRQNQAPDVLDAASLGFAEDFVHSSEAVQTARETALVGGARPISSGVASALTFLARLIDAHAVVEIGTGTGVTGLALFDGMNAEGILTSIDAEADWQIEARTAFTKAKVPAQRFRLIGGSALDVLPKLREEAYDLVLVNGDKLEYVEYVAQALRLLRPGGVIVVHDVLWQGLVADPRNDDDETVIIREALQAIQDAPSLTPVMIPLGDGLMVAMKARASTPASQGKLETTA